MTLTKDHKYSDGDGDWIEAEYDSAASSEVLAFIKTSDEGVYVLPQFAAPLALNILGHDRPDDDPLATRFEVEGQGAFIASTPAARDQQLSLAAALLMAIDGYDRREARRSTAAERRERAAESLSSAVARIEAARFTSKTYGDGEIGKLREALGKYDAALAN